MANLTLNGDAGANSIIGGIGNDSLFGFAGDDTLEGAQGNDTLDGGLGIDLLKGGAGNDTYIITDADDNVLELAGAGIDNVLAAVDYVLTVNVENLTLTGTEAIAGTGNAQANVLTGNDLDNVLDGAAGNDTLDGGIGADTLIGGTGNDTYIVDDVNDEITELTAAGIDTVKSSVSYELADNLENLTLTGVDDIDATGNALANVLTGNSGINLLDGGAGADILKGGDGDDTYAVGLKKVGNTAVFEDTVIELVNQGVDTIVLSGDIDNTVANTITLGATIENLFADDSHFTKLNFTGNALANEIHGNNANNKILGLSGADTLLGGGGNDTLDGGVGIDSLVGGTGNDTYLVDMLVTGTGASTAISNTFADAITEAANAGSDTISLRGSAALTTAKTFDLNNYLNIENINASATLSTKINLTGNALDNALTGNNAANTLIGDLGNDTLDGGLGNDSLNGGDGDDTYVISALGDVIAVDTDGLDTVISAVNFSIAARDDLENITLTGAAITATGNDGANILTGNATANILDGGADIDTLIGGAGNDIYIVDDTNDEVVELTAGGTDTVKSSVSYELGDNVENLTLTGGENIDAIGNALANTLIGNSGDNLLDGGAGADILRGGAGDDTYAVNLKAVGSVVSMADTVTELANQGTDTIVLSGSIITGVVSTIALSANVENLFAEDTGITKLNITGNALANEIHGNEVDNKLDGGAGNDILNSGAGNDTLLGGAGLDVLIGGIGKDLLTGSLGADTFDFNSILDSAVGANRDVISDFSHAQLDIINLLDIDADTLTAGNQAFHFITTPFTGAAGELQFSGGIVSGDTNGDGTADFEIALTGVTTLVAGDFVL